MQRESACFLRKPTIPLTCFMALFSASPSGTQAPRDNCYSSLGITFVSMDMILLWYCKTLPLSIRPGNKGRLLICLHSSQVSTLTLSSGKSTCWQAQKENKCGGIGVPSYRHLYPCFSSKQTILDQRSNPTEEPLPPFSFRPL